MRWEQVREIARWEYLQKVRSKGFIISLILFPVFILLLGFLPSILVSEGPSSARTIGLIDPSGLYVHEVSRELADQGELDGGEQIWNVREYPSGPKGVAEATEDALAEETEGFLEVVEGNGGGFVWRSVNLADLQTVEAVQQSLREVVRRKRVHDAGLDASIAGEILAPVDIAYRRISEEGEDESDATAEFLVTFFSAFVGIMLFMLLILTTGQTLVRGLVEEKSNRIMEILVGTTRPTELMWGKLLGLSALGLTQVLAWALLGGGVLLFFSSSALVPAGMLSSALEPLPLVLIYLMLGYLFYAAIFVGAGSLVTTEQEAQFVTQYITMLIAAPLAFAIVVMQDPNAPWVEAISYIPFLTPALMMLRVVASDPGVGTVAGTIAVLLLSTAAVTWGASRIFQTAILLYGKRPSMREVLRWMRR